LGALVAQNRSPADKLDVFEAGINLWARFRRSNPQHYLLSLIAVPLLAVATIIASLAGGCCRPRHGASESKRIAGIVAAVLSW